MEQIPMVFTPLSIRWAHADGSALGDQLAHNRNSPKMKTFVALVVTALLLICSPVHALDRDQRLRVVSPVHTNERVLVTGQEQREKRHGHCVDDGTREQDPVCASNGKKYLNMNRFEYNKCLIQAEDGEDITIVDLDFCREALLEDLESEGLL
ncbi:hypothetical protein PR003_g24602 [Phytophthora rubi]|uniref:Kazal-like domain-containing protein n=1 Tax=Phytophthora rubi TaxID=129364 RepID=A0A6A3INQ5_9STRA|nr:hypothetical protein PR001_g23378 [Phytophthora rubi]KAE9293055.1 hypothetical protein PR003_g24602 [Phytophthora rubi]